jgi:uncharacterized phage protein (TIGR02216 family)
MFGKRAADLAGFAASLLGWRPDDFWNSTPAELAVSLGASHLLPDAPDRNTIEALMQRFPDAFEGKQE